MYPIIIAGNGKIGSTIAFVLSKQGYKVHIIDEKFLQEHELQKIPNIHYSQLNISEHASWAKQYCQKHQIKAIVAAVPHNKILDVAHLAVKNHLHYFDLTEDVQVGKEIKQLAETADTAFVSHCGIAPGLINIIAHDLMQEFDTIDTVKLRCGAIPTHTSNALHYALNWSTAGLINEYLNPCAAIENGSVTLIPPLHNLEEIKIDGLSYEAFNTSGGLVNLEQYVSKIKQMTYKTIRYPGHCEKMQFLLQDLKLNQNRELLKEILENAIPTTKQDVVLFYITVHGSIKKQFIKKDYVNKFYPKTFAEETFSAIQISTASAICAVIELVLQNPENHHGSILQTAFHLKNILNTSFGEYFKAQSVI